MDTLIYGDGTKTILLRMKQQFQIYMTRFEKSHLRRTIINL